MLKLNHRNPVSAKGWKEIWGGGILFFTLSHSPAPTQKEKFVAYIKLGVDRLAILITSDRFLMLDRSSSPEMVVTMEVWFSGIIRMEIISEPLSAGSLYYLHFLVSDEVCMLFYVCVCVCACVHEGI